MIQVTKRDGRIKEFNSKYIQIAVDKAVEEVECEDEDLGLRISQLVEDSLKDNEITEIGIEEIQDLVIEFLNQENKKVAIAYKDYRDKRTIKRESGMELINSIKGLVDFSNIDIITENSNKQSTLASTQRDLIAGEVSKYIAKTTMIPSYIIKAHEEGIIHNHDMDCVKRSQETQVA